MGHVMAAMVMVMCMCLHQEMEDQRMTTVTSTVMPTQYTLLLLVSYLVNPGSQYNTGAYVVSVASSLVHNMMLELT